MPQVPELAGPVIQQADNKQTIIVSEVQIAKEFCPNVTPFIPIPTDLNNGLITSTADVSPQRRKGERILSLTLRSF